MRVEKKDAHRINQHIRNTPEVRLVGDGIEPAVYKINDALRMADAVAATKTRSVFAHFRRARPTVAG